MDRLSVSAGDDGCSPSFGGMRFDGDGLALAVAYACTGTSDVLRVEARFPADLARGHRHLVTLTSGDDAWEDVASVNHPGLRFELSATPPPAPRAPVLVPLLRMGLEHILTGYDHLLFLLGLVLVGRPLRSLVAAVTAFTVAHSVTLALSAFGAWAPSPRIIEPCIALSIAYVGIENWFVTDARGRWRITFLFGLVHGFGFAGALRDIALPRAEVPAALFAFNLGVELGQLAVLAALLPLVLAVRKTEIWERVGLRACTMTIAAVGLVWFVSRLHGSV
jgi:hydrogenase/urease accessory protein HupE